MVYNEPEFVPIWVKYYGSIFPQEQLYIIDHGTDDGSLDHVGKVNIIRIPRTPKNNKQRSALIRHIVAGLLNYYKTVITVDVDEMLIPDPRHYKDLADFCENRTESVVTSIGLNVVHLTASEADYDSAHPVLAQRKWAQFVSPMCKPSVVSKPVTFGDGFHGCTVPPAFQHLYMFHLRYFDLKCGLARLARTRAMEWWSPKAGSHQRVEDEQWINSLNRYNTMKKGALLTTEAADQQLEQLCQDFLSRMTPDARGIYNHKPPVVGRNLIEIPESFSAHF
ncbi:glycosyltransferase family 2 protein [Siccirubricoccus deserti]